MKTLYMLEGPTRKQSDEDNVYEAMKALGNIDLVTGEWNVPEDFGAVIRRVEKNGPNDFDIPLGFIDHSDAEVVIAQFCPFSSKGMDVLKDTRIIGLIRGGIENMDLAAATEHNILVINAVGRNAVAVAEYTMGMLLTEARSIAFAHHEMLNGNQHPDFSPAHEFSGKTAGLFGLGHIGRLVAQYLQGFDVNVIAYDPFVKPEDVEGTGVTLVEKDTLFTDSDYICIHARLLPETYHTIGAHEISLMKPTAYLVNTARGGLVDNDALLAALQEGRIAGAALDVFEEEPLPNDSPFLKLQNVTLTPHRAGATYEADVKSPKMVCDRISDVIKGVRTDGILNPEVLETPEFKEWAEKARIEMYGE